VQDVYKIDSKRIIAGRIESGAVRTGQEVRILPEGGATKIKSVEKFLEKRVSASVGESIGITTQDSVFLDRGSIICEDDKSLYLTQTFKANVFWLARDEFDKDKKITMRCATQEVLCSVERIKKRIDSSTLRVIENDANVLKNLEVGEVVIKTKRPIVVMEFSEMPEMGRFVFVRDDNVCAGGIVTGV